MLFFIHGGLVLSPESYNRELPAGHILFKKIDKRFFFSIFCIFWTFAGGEVVVRRFLISLPFLLFPPETLIGPVGGMERSTGKDRSRRKVNGVTRHGQVDCDRASNLNNKFGSTTLPKWLVPREIKKAKPEVSDELVGWILYGFARVHPFVRELTKAVSIGQPHWTGCIPIPASASQVKNERG